MKQLDLNETPRFPRAIEIQTTSACNARCGVCPHSDVVAEVGAALMASKLLWKILEDCAENREQLEWIMPYYNAEPFIDKRMIDVLRFIKINVGTSVELSSNGSLLSADIAERLLVEDLLHIIRFSVFGASELEYETNMAPLSWNVSQKRIKEFLTLHQALGSTSRVEIILVGTDTLSRDTVSQARALWEPLGAKVRIFGYLDRAGNNRGDGDLMPKHQSRARLVGCDLNRPFERMCILRTGRCTICSQDWRGLTDLGDTNVSSLREIWEGETYKLLRAKVCGEALAEPQFICRRCKLAMVE